MQHLAVIFWLAMSVTSVDQVAIERLCAAQWGELIPLKQSCIAEQQQAAEQLRQALVEADSEGWYQDIEEQCAMSKFTDYRQAASCVLIIEDKALAKRGDWVRPVGVPEEDFLKIRAICTRDFGLSFSSVQFCIDHSTRGYR